MNDRHLKLKDAIEVVRETVADEYIESTLELRLLDKSLTADVVEVVRCKDCKYLDKGENDSESWCECTAHFGKYFAVNEDGFCSFGERAEA